MKILKILGVLIVIGMVGNLLPDQESTSTSGVSTEDQLAINKCYDRTGDYASCYVGHKSN